MRKFCKGLKLSLIITALLTALLLSGCGGSADSADTQAAQGVTVVDAENNSFVLTPQSRVACGYASFAQCWQLAGGSLVGVTSDAPERGLELGEDTEIIGTVKSLDLEKLVATEPDYVILSADLSAHTQLRQNLEDLGIGYGYFRVDTFEDYKALMAQFCAVTGRDDLYEKNVLEPEENIARLIDSLPEPKGETALLIRAYSTGMKAKTDDNLAGQIIKEFGLENIADAQPSLLEDLSLEQIILDDPDYIFVITMGDPQSAEEYLKEHVENDPAWSSLTAVKNGRYIILPQDLFHYKPNERWDESYEYLAKIIYPEIFE